MLHIACLYIFTDDKSISNIFQARGGKTSHQVLRDILMDVQISHIPPNLLKTWAFEIYKTPTDYWTFRKMVNTR